MKVVLGVFLQGAVFYLALLTCIFCNKIYLLNLQSQWPEEVTGVMENKNKDAKDLAKVNMMLFKNREVLCFALWSHPPGTVYSIHLGIYAYTEGNN